MTAGGCCAAREDEQMNGNTVIAMMVADRWLRLMQKEMVETERRSKHSNRTPRSVSAKQTRKLATSPENGGYQN
jgi:hypothetical protein